MASEIIVNATREETRVALLENGLVTEIYIDRAKDPNAHRQCDE
jgi:Ribonuclease G/E